MAKENENTINGRQNTKNRE